VVALAVAMTAPPSNANAILAACCGFGISKVSGHVTAM
jgi:hypothetical protein